MPTFTISHSLRALQAATISARERSGDKHIGTTAERGMFTVVRVIPNGRKAATVTPLSQPMPIHDAIQFLHAL